ncbi:hypothetical protein QR46_4707 [Giardia duodenalis assemblage B]|uniref:Uncharacterized protein n=3 Tax=Giardia intestinalis TaxID=5741 RepID=A0A132NMS6_GIAIN|nr:Hypothetical protein GL50581_2870 [Giardia intestinalis ATCC 50581]ESU40883.1 Hypothetical protein GSB_2338 [Giardia intestinalis]KWX11334.1 hypothetical protein QR46_4707 [Giardia intestinalis assemblage B]
MSTRNARLRDLSMRIFYKNYAYLMEVDAEVEEYGQMMSELRTLSRNISIDYLSLSPKDLREAHLKRAIMTEKIHTILPQKLFQLITAKKQFESEVLEQHKVLEADIRDGEEEDSQATPIPEGYLWAQVWSGYDVDERVCDILARAPRSVLLAFAAFFSKKNMELPICLAPFVDAAVYNKIVLPTSSNLAKASLGPHSLIRSIVCSPNYKVPEFC